jgi:hypothetical protein
METRRPLTRLLRVKRKKALLERYPAVAAMRQAGITAIG